ncbi:histidinolphosphatase [Gonapodya sp. JEL0774]|nr:histidinolphosphatase [Gonapodya sp. JEL0774]
MISFHSHSGQFCLHARGTLESVVESALSKGVEVLGLSEHMPRSRKEDLYPEESEIGPEDLAATFEAYVVEARRLQQVYDGRIHLLVGMETEHIPDAGYLGAVARLRERHRLDYLVGSLHHVDGTPIDYDIPTLERAEEQCRKAVGALASDTAAGTEELFIRYFDQQYEMLSALKPEVVGHFDLIRLWRVEHPLSEEVWSRIRRNVDFVIGYGGLFEVNAAAYRKGLPEAYPQKDILKLIISRHGRVTLSDDTHSPEGVSAYYENAVAYLKSLGLTSVYALMRKDGGVVKQVEWSLSKVAEAKAVSPTVIS